MEAKESNENQNLNEDELLDTEIEAEPEDDEIPESQDDIAMGRPKPDRPPTGRITSEGEEQAIG